MRYGKNPISPYIKLNTYKVYYVNKMGTIASNKIIRLV